jgi:hypothetical protein
VYKHSKPLPADIVRFQPYPDSEDRYRGTTVLPYLEAFFNYGVDDGGMNTLDRGATAGKINTIEKQSGYVKALWSML